MSAATGAVRFDKNPTRISNQATFVYDSDGDGRNDANGTTDAYVCPATP